MPSWNPRFWVSPVPTGAGHVKPHHFGEIAKTAWENRDQPGLAWRILTQGVCDGCALGTKGIRDFTLDGIHLCTVRLNLLRLNTMPALDITRVEDVSALNGLDSRSLRSLGRLPYPMIRRKGGAGFRRITWDEALATAADTIRRTVPERLAFYLTSRGLTNEVYYVAQKAARFLGTNNIDNSARLCHAPSTVALKQTIGVGASTCSYKDWIGTDLLVLIGSHVANNQPVTTKYMYYAKQRGTRIAVINPFREPGLERYWIPSIVESALFGTRLTDEFFQVDHGGDIGFLNGVLKHLCEQDWLDKTFIENHTTGFGALELSLSAQTWDQLEKASGSTRDEMFRFAQMYARSKTAVFVWSMGITQHLHGVDNVKAIVNLALARGMIGREFCGLVPIRGHSGVQGGAEVGAVPHAVPGGLPINEESLKRLESLWGFPPPSEKGLAAAEMIEAASRGELDVLFSAGGNFLDTMPAPEFVRAALGRVGCRIHQDIVLTSQMFVEPKDCVLLFPAQTRYEQTGGGTETSTERYIYFSPEIPGRRIGEARAEWQTFMELAERVYPERSHLVHFEDGLAIRQEIARAVPFYAGIETLARAGDAIQYGGRLLCRNGQFPTADGRARFSPVCPPEPTAGFRLSTRRGKQFNSIVHADHDPLTGARREDVLMNAIDAKTLGLQGGDAVIVTSEHGRLLGRCRIATIHRGNVQVHWPEGNVLIAHGRIERQSGIPDYNVEVRILKAGS